MNTSISIVLALLVVHWHAAHAVLVKDGVYSFTTCNKEGPTGPSLADCKNHNAQYQIEKMHTFNGYQLWTVPSSGLYEIEAFGAQGGKAKPTGSERGGYGAHVKGNFRLEKGDELVIVVGQHGLHSSFGGGGGGGSWVVKAGVGGPQPGGGWMPLTIAGGGGSGAACLSAQGGHGRADQNGGKGQVGSSGGSAGDGGTRGEGGKAGSTSNSGSGGGGWLSNGKNAGNSYTGGKSFPNGLEGGFGSHGGIAGFGGGGGKGNHGGGGGGGYSGGGGGTPNCPAGQGGGGGSFVGPKARGKEMLAGVNQKSGLVQITLKTTTTSSTSTQTTVTTTTATETTTTTATTTTTTALCNGKGDDPAVCGTIAIESCSVKIFHAYCPVFCNSCTTSSTATATTMSSLTITTTTPATAPKVDRKVQTNVHDTGCTCAGISLDSGEGGGDCRSTHDSRRYCYVVAGVCSDGVESFGIAGHHYSFLACNTVEIVGNDDAPEAAASATEEGAEEEEEEANHDHHRRSISAGEVVAIILSIILLAGLGFTVYALNRNGINICASVSEEELRRRRSSSAMSAAASVPTETSFSNPVYDDSQAIQKSVDAGVNANGDPVYDDEYLNVNTNI